MWWQTFAVKWFILYESFLGVILFGLGGWLIFKSRPVAAWLLRHRASEQPPPIIRTLLKYFFLFTLPGLIFSFYPFSWPELLFSIWSLMMVYVIGIQLVRWPQTRQLIREKAQSMPGVIRTAGAMMMAVSVIIFILDYYEILKMTSV